jgi:hypothetical protein
MSDVSNTSVDLVLSYLFFSKGHHLPWGKVFVQKQHFVSSLSLDFSWLHLMKGRILVNQIALGICCVQTGKKGISFGSSLYILYLQIVFLLDLLGRRQKQELVIFGSLCRVGDAIRMCQINHHLRKEAWSQLHPIHCTVCCISCICLGFYNITKVTKLYVIAWHGEIAVYMAIVSTECCISWTTVLSDRVLL